MFANAYQVGPKLIFRGVLLGSCFVGLVGFYLSKQVNFAVHPAGSVQSPSESVAFFELHPEASAHQSVDEEKPPSNPETCRVSVGFPQKVRRWCDLIMAAAEEHHLPPDLIAAVIWVESGGDPLAYSSSGAVGLMQVMPRDGRASQFQCVNGPCFANRPTIEQLQDAEFNVKYGTKLFAGLLKRYGNYRDALKAYGPMKVGYSYADKVLSIYRKFGK